jgi:hypothetical protein
MADVAITNTFTAATAIVASQMNTNFSDLVNYINARNTGSASWDVLKSAGACTLSSTLAVTGATTLSSTLGVTGATTLTGGLATALTIAPTTNQIVLGATRTVTLTAPTPASASRTVTFPDLSADYSVVGTAGTQATIAGAKTFTTQLIGKGTTTNDNAGAGYIGEVVESYDTSAGNCASSGTYSDITSIELTAGDWTVYGQPIITYNLANFTGVIYGAVSLYSGNTTTDHVIGKNTMPIPFPLSTNTYAGCTITYRVSLSGTATLYLKAAATYSTGTPQQFGSIWARRER